MFLFLLSLRMNAFSFEEFALKATISFAVLPGRLFKILKKKLTIFFKVGCYNWVKFDRYGYKDVRKENHQIFEQLLIESLEKFIRREAQERQLESDGDDDDSDFENDPSRVLVGPNGSVYFGVPEGGNVINQYHLPQPPPPMEATTSEASGHTDPELSLENELAFLHKAKESGVVYLMGHGDIRAKKESWFIKKLVINYFYAFMRKNCRRGIATLSVPHTHLIQVAMTYMV